MEKSATPQQQIFPHFNRGQQQPSFKKSVGLFILYRLRTKLLLFYARMNF